MPDRMGHGKRRHKAALECFIYSRAAIDLKESDHNLLMNWIRYLYCSNRSLT